MAYSGVLIGEIKCRRCGWKLRKIKEREEREGPCPLCGRRTSKAQKA